MRGNDHQRRLFDDFVGIDAHKLSPSEIVRLYDSFLAGWEYARKLPVRLQLDSNLEIPAKYMERRGDYHVAIPKPVWAITIERLEWRASENMVYVYFANAPAV